MFHTWSKAPVISSLDFDPKTVSFPWQLIYATVLLIIVKVNTDYSFTGKKRYFHESHWELCNKYVLSLVQSSTLFLKDSGAHQPPTLSRQKTKTMSQLCLRLKCCNFLELIVLFSSFTKENQSSQCNLLEEMQGLYLIYIANIFRSFELSLSISLKI